MKTLTTVATAVALTLAVNVQAEVSITHVFQADQPALASQVNDNFTSVLDGVNANAMLIRDGQTEAVAALAQANDINDALTSEITDLTEKLNNAARYMMPIVKTTTGIELGTLMSTNGSTYTVLTKSLGIMTYEQFNNKVTPSLMHVNKEYVRYNSSDCSGVEYYGSDYALVAGQVVATAYNEDRELMQITSDYTPEINEIGSQISNGECYTHDTPLSMFGLVREDQLAVNDYSVTQVPNDYQLTDTALILVKPTL